MDLLGFSTEDLDKLNNKRPDTKCKSSAPSLPPLVDLSKYSSSSQSKYLSLRESEQLRVSMRHNNQNPQNSSPEKGQSANLAKIQRITKKLKTLSEDCKEEVLKELKELSLNKFITEAAHFLSENKFNPKDFLSLIEVASVLHQRYPDFQRALMAELKKQHKDGDMIRKRYVLRFISEMICFGLWNDVPGFLKVTRDYCANTDSNSILLLSCVFKPRAEELFGFPSTSELNSRESGENVPFNKVKALMDNESNLLVKSLRDFLKSALRFIEELHMKCKRTEERNKKIKEEFCELDDIKIQESLALRSELSKTREAVLVFCDILNEKPPVFEEEKAEIPEEPKDANPFEIFETDEDRDFYLKLVTFEDKEENKADKDRFDLFKKKLIQTSSKETADLLSDEFLKMATKQNRKLLIDSLCNYTKNIQTLPFYARIVATIGLTFKKFPTKIVKTLENEFIALQEQADPGSLDIRLRNLRFLSEFLKFQLYSPLNILRCFEMCLRNFTGENIEIACCLLQCSGRYLCRHPGSSERVNLMINRMMRLKERKNLPQETEHKIEEAVFTCRPKEKIKKKKTGPVLYEFIKYKFLALGPQNTQDLIKILLLCPMPESQGFIVKSVFKAVRRGHISNLPNISKVLAGLKLNSCFTSTVVVIVDYLCEDILSDLRVNDFRRSQHRILMIKFFAELHCYNLIDSDMVFKMLFTILASPDVFKVKLIWALLDTVKQLLSSFQYKQNLKLFLTDFKKYILSKPEISIEMEFLVMDLLETFRNNKVAPDSLPAPKVQAEVKEEEKAEESSSSDGEATFDEEFNKIINDEMGNAKPPDNFKEREISTFFADSPFTGFKVLLKKAGKVHARNVQLPDEHPLLVSAEERKRAEAVERERLSKVVVDLNQRRLMEENN